MTLLIGLDEAGYGPNLGPLVIGASVWRTDRSIENLDLANLFENLSELIETDSNQVATDKIRIADSKKLYQSGKSLSALEHPLMVLLSVCDQAPAQWREAFGIAPPADREAFFEEPWNWDFDRPLPDRLLQDELGWKYRFRKFDPSPVRFACRVIGAASFNQICTKHGNKASALSRAGMECLASILSSVEEDALILCDKHGGRNQYLSVVEWLAASSESSKIDAAKISKRSPAERRRASLFIDDEGPFVETLCEGRSESAYRWNTSLGTREIRFRPKGESFVPTAAASMLAKYLRELAMEAFNHYWRSKSPDLRPTAGYPVDANRFLEDIRPLLAQNRIELESVWRCR